ncbi:universal stress protein PHOS32-like [Populus alba x Populus x berolinensis]|nr:universal stress protein PHOS32-like [Populus alba x Populus x berolinensis]
MGKARTFGVGMDYSPASKAALRWAAENLIDEGDRVILIQAQPPKADHTRKQLFEDNGSPLVPLEEFREINYSKQYGLTHDPEVLDILDTVSKTKGLENDVLMMVWGAQAKVVAKVYWGDPREKLIDSVDDLKLDSLVIGSRGLGAIKRKSFLLSYAKAY